MSNQGKFYLLWYPVIIILFGLISYFSLEKDRKRERITGLAIVVNGNSIRIDGRLITFKKNIACQLGQPATKDGHTFDCGEWAKKTLEQIVKNHPVTCKIHYGSNSRGDIGICYQRSQEKISLGDKMRRLGAVFPYMGRGRTIGKHDAFAHHAAKNKLGIWSFDQVEHPRTWLKKQRTAHQ